MKIEFSLYQRIVNGDLRPDLPKFDFADGLQGLIDEYSSYDAHVYGDIGDNNSFEIEVYNWEPGQIVDQNIQNEAKPRLVILLPENPENNLINLDIPPPVDAKSELFFPIIVLEFRRIKTAARSALIELSNVEKLRDYGTRNIQFAKRLAGDTHLLKKALSDSKIDDLDNPNTLILHSVKKHLVYSIEFLQQTFHPYTGIEPQNESLLEDELFDNEYSRRFTRAMKLAENIEKRNLERLRAEISIYTTTESQIFHLKEKLAAWSEKYGERENLPFMKSHSELMESELERLIEEKYSQQQEESLERLDIKSQLNFLARQVLELQFDRKSEELRYLKRTGFIEKTELRIEGLKNLLEIQKVSEAEEALYEDLRTVVQTAQTRRSQARSEDEWNDYLSDLLRAKNYYVSDQTRSGASAKSTNPNIQSGELDITIRDIHRSGTIISIIEAFVLMSCGPKNTIVKNHIDKLIKRYDSAGNSENYVIVYVKAKGFEDLWQRFKDHLVTIVFDSKIEFHDTSAVLSSTSDIRTGYHEHERNGRTLVLRYIFADFSQ